MDTISLQQLEVLVYVFVGLAVLTLGGLVIYVIASVRRRDTEASAAFYDADNLVVRPSLLVVGQVLALVREEPGAPIRVEIDGVKYDSLAEIEDPGVRRQVVDAALEFIQFTGVVGAMRQELTPLGKTETWREDLRQESKAELELARHTYADESARPEHPPPDPEVEEQFLKELIEAGQVPPSPEPPTLVSSIQHSLKPKAVDTDPSRTFVDDIEDIVQRRIRMVPALVERGLHVRPGPAGKVLFTFEGREYQRVDEIPNLTARELVQDAIREWDETT